VAASNVGGLAMVKTKQLVMAEQCRMAKQGAAGNGSCVERHLVDDDTKVYPTEVVYKPSL